MEAAIFVGVQATGKSTFYRRRFVDTHIRINLDMLRTRHREQILLDACLNAKQPFVVDNTNVTRAERAAYISQAKEHRFRVVGYYFACTVQECKRRNASRPEMVPLPGLLSTYTKLQLPEPEEGFDALFYVALDDDGNFAVSEWNREI